MNGGKKKGRGLRGLNTCVIEPWVKPRHRATIHAICCRCIRSGGPWSRTVVIVASSLPRSHGSDVVHMGGVRKKRRTRSEDD